MKPFKPVIIIPSYNTGASLLQSTVRGALASQLPVTVVIDGSTDGSETAVESLMSAESKLSIIIKKENSGKGGALLRAATEALRQGYSHALVMDADGQHPATMIHPMIALSRDTPEALIMGQPVFGDDAPLARVIGRKLTTFWTSLETLWSGLGDTLFGMRVYPLEPMVTAFQQTSFARGFEFDPEIAVRMAWAGCRPIKVDVPVRYLSAVEGGISHFHYLRDNAKLTLLHFRLIPELILFRLIPFLRKRRKWKKSSQSSSH